MLPDPHLLLSFPNKLYSIIINMHIYSLPALTPTFLLSLPDLCVQLNESDFSALVVIDDSSVVLNQLHVDEQGTYRCSLQNRNGIVFYRATFLLTGRVQLFNTSSQWSLKGAKMRRPVCGKLTLLNSFHRRKQTLQSTFVNSKDTNKTL